MFQTIFQSCPLFSQLIFLTATIFDLIFFEQKSFNH